MVEAGLPSDCLTKVFENHRQHFTDGQYGDGLLNMMEEFR